MISPGFFGFYNAHRGLIASQNALSTVSHNISNANTEGYSRQRVDLEAYNAYANPTPYQLTGGQLGQGPWVQQVTRSRDIFLDTQFRQANSLSGMNTAIRDALSQMEGIFNEPSDNGINSAIQNFFDAAQELSLHPSSLAVRADYIQHAVDVITVFQQQAGQLLDLRTNLVGDPVVAGTVATSQLAIHVGQVNTLLSNIANINRNIISIKASGAQPNDLLDQRDKLLDQLSNLVDINVTNYDNGQIDITIGGQMMIKGADQIDSLTVAANPNAPPGPPTPTWDTMPALVSTTTGGVVLNDGTGAEITSGVIKGIIDMGGNNPALSTIRGVLGQMDTLLSAIVNEINTLQTAGRDLNGNTPAPAMFVANAALNPGQPLALFHWEVNSTILTDSRRVAAAINDGATAGGFAGVGDGRNALAIAQLRNNSATLGTGYIDYFNSTTSKLGIDSRSYQDSSTSQGNVINSLNQRRQSVSGVNVDEEMIDMLRYQRAFEATSKTIAMFDEVYKTIINMT